MHNTTIMNDTTRTIRLLTALMLGTLLLMQASDSLAKGEPNTDTATMMAADASPDNTAGKPDGQAVDAGLNTAASKAEEQRQLALSKRPSVVGLEALQQEAEGLRNLPDFAIQQWRMSRLIPEI